MTPDMKDLEQQQLGSNSDEVKRNRVSATDSDAGGEEDVDDTTNGGGSSAALESRIALMSTKKEQERAHMFRVMLGWVLVMTGVVTTVAFVYLRRQENENFETAVSHQCSSIHCRHWVPKLTLCMSCRLDGSVQPVCQNPGHSSPGPAAKAPRFLH